jgi:hypothetical protein
MAGYSGRMRCIPFALVILLAAGCGGSSRPQLQQADAAPLIALTQRIAAEDACAQSRDIPKLRTRAIALVNAHRVPAALEESLLGGVQALAAEQPVCLPSVPVATTPVAPPHPPHAPHFPFPFGHHHHGHGH